MKSYFDCWVQVASSLLPQAMAGEPEFGEALPKPMDAEPLSFTAIVTGDVAGDFSLMLDGSVLETPLMGEGVEQREAWGELLREIAESAAGEMLASTGKRCRVEKFEAGGEALPATQAFSLKTGEREWMLLVRDRVRAKAEAVPPEKQESEPGGSEIGVPALSPGLELLLDVELEASLRFGSCELPLGEILDLGPGDVVQLDRQVNEPVDLIVADKIVARGEVVLVNGNFGLRVTEVAAPKKRLEGIRCLF